MGKNQWHIVVFKAYMVAAFSFVLLALVLKGCVTINKYYPTKRDTVVIYKDKPCIQYGMPHIYSPYYNMLPFINIDTFPENHINLLGSGRLVIDTTDGRVLKDTLILK